MSHKRVCYFDNNATTKIAPEVVEAMIPVLREHWGNPSSAYRFGKEVADLLVNAREQVAALINAEPSEIVFTSCGTESNNAAIHSAIVLHPDKRHVVLSSVEHSANIGYAEYLQRRGYDVTFLPVDADGSLDLHLLDQSLRPDTAIVSVMWANNETGVIFPVDEIGVICRSRNVPFHTDAVQAAGKIPIDLQNQEIDFLSLSAHKIHAPKGIGLLYVNRRSRFHPYVIGGHQERGRRGGTENVANIVAFGKAAEVALANVQEENSRVKGMRDRLERTILKTIPNSMRNGAPDPRLPNTTNISFDSVEAEAILLALDQEGICVSSGSACTTGSLKPSHVLTAMGVPLARARGSVRFSLGIDNWDEDVDYLLSKLPPIIAKLRAASPLSEESPTVNSVSEVSNRRGTQSPVPSSNSAVV